MGCVLVDLGEVRGCVSPSRSYLVDGVSPVIDISISNWAHQLVTVRKNEGTAENPYPHVLLTFQFGTAVSLTEIEMDLFLCPEWGIGAPLITAYLNQESNLIFTPGLPFTVNTPSQSSCNSLSTVTVTGDIFQASSYLTVHILVSFSSNPDIEWTHVGEIRFIGMEVQQCEEEEFRRDFQFWR
jgi:hypothetical protein